MRTLAIFRSHAVMWNYKHFLLLRNWLTPFSETIKYYVSTVITKTTGSFMFTNRLFYSIYRSQFGIIHKYRTLSRPCRLNKIIFPNKKWKNQLVSEPRMEHATTENHRPVTVGIPLNLFQHLYYTLSLMFCFASKCIFTGAKGLVLFFFALKLIFKGQLTYTYRSFNRFLRFLLTAKTYVNN